MGEINKIFYHLKKNKVVAKLAGHANPNVTLLTYAHFLDEDNDEVSQVMGKFEKLPYKNHTQKVCYLLMSSLEKREKFVLL